MDHTPSPTPGGPDPGPSVPPPDHPDVDRRKQGDEPGIAYEEDIPSDGEDPEAQAEIRHIPAKPELSPVPDRLRN